MGGAWNFLAAYNVRQVIFRETGFSPGETNQIKTNELGREFLVLPLWLGIPRQWPTYSSWLSEYSEMDGCPIIYFLFNTVIGRYGGERDK